jgi:hypothetical protein
MCNYVMDVALLWTMYTLTLLKSFELFYDRLIYIKYITIIILIIFEPNLDIIQIIMF